MPFRRITAALALTLATALTAAPMPATAQAKGCPPGLAKKNNGCMPPGLARKGNEGYRVGDRLDGDYVIIPDPRRYDLDPRDTYARRDGKVFRIDRDTRAILDILGGIATLAN